MSRARLSLTLTLACLLWAHGAAQGQPIMGWQGCQPCTAGGGAGDVVGPPAATDECFARFDLATGKLLQDSVVCATDTGILSGATQFNLDNLRLDGNTLSTTNANGALTVAPNGTGQVLMPDGTAALPSISFSGETDKGFYSSAGNAMRWTPDGGTTYVDFRGSALAMSGFAGILYTTASGTVPALCPDAIFDTDTGIGRAGAGQLSLIADGTEGLRVEATRATFAGRILGKKGVDVASANDITLGSGNYFVVTGVTQVNTIAATNWTAGSVITLQFSGAVTVAHNTAGTGASLLLAGAGNFSATADDTLTLVYDGTTWRETGRAVI